MRKYLVTRVQWAEVTIDDDDDIDNVIQDLNYQDYDTVDLWTEEIK